MILFFELSISRLEEQVKDDIISKLDNVLLSNYQIHKPHHYLPSEANLKGKTASNTIITGIPKQIDSKSDFKGFIMIPISTGSVMTFSMVPIIDQYDVYEIREAETDQSFLIAHAKGKEKLPENKIRVAGVLKELKTNEKESHTPKKYLEAIYYLDDL